VVLVISTFSEERSNRSIDTLISVAKMIVTVVHVDVRSRVREQTLLREHRTLCKTMLATVFALHAKVAIDPNIQSSDR
jgi:hypothetical protein